MHRLAISGLKEALRSVAFLGQPRTGSEYWLFGSPSADSASLRLLPELLGYGWAWQGGELVVDYIGGPYSGQSDVVSWNELTEILGGGTRILVRWAGSRLPVRVILVPALGVRIAIEHMDLDEVKSLHRRVVGRIIDVAVVESERDKLMVGCDTLGLYEADPERLLRNDSSLSFRAPNLDFLLASPRLIALGVEPNVHHEITNHNGLRLLVSSDHRVR